jgi:hypothetical protein
LGILGIENRKPKIVNFSLSKPATTTKNYYFLKLKIIIIKILASARTQQRVRADGFLPRLRTIKPVRGVNADARRHPNDVRGRPDGNFHPKLSVMTSLSTPSLVRPCISFFEIFFPSAFLFLCMWSTLVGWLQHMPALPRLLRKTSNTHNF